MLPKLVDPRRLADQGQTLKGEIAVADLPRVLEVVESADNVAAEFAFDRDEHFRVRVSGFVSGRFSMQCQRCMDIVEVPLQQPVDLAVVAGDDQSRSVPRDLDPWEAVEQASLYELVEDEILLALPLVAMHPEGQCQAPKIPDQELPEPEAERQKPFEILKDLANTPDK